MLSQTVVYLHHGILISNKKKETIDTRNDLDESPGNYAAWKKTITKGFAVYLYILYNILERRKLRERENTSAVARGLGRKVGSGKYFRRDVGWEGSRCGNKRAARGITVVLQQFSILTVVHTWPIYVIKLHKTKYTHMKVKLGKSEQDGSMVSME